MKRLRTFAGMSWCSAGGIGTLLLLNAVSAQCQEPVPTDNIPITPTALVYVMGGPTTVTFHGKDIPLRTAVEQLMNAAHRPSTNVLSQDLETRPVTVNWNETPFWQAARDLEQQTGLQWNSMSPDYFPATLALGFTSPYILPPAGLTGLTIADARLITVTANDITRSSRREWDLSALKRDEMEQSEIQKAALKITAYFDPRLKIVPGSVSIAVEAPHPNQLNGMRSPAPPLNKPSVGVFNFPLDLGSLRDDTRIPLVSGSISAQVMTKNETWHVPDIIKTKNATRQISGATYNLTEVSVAGDTLSFSIAQVVPVPNTPGAATFGTMMAMGALPPGTSVVRVLDNQGAEVPMTTSKLTGSGNSFTSTLTYALRAPVKDSPDKVFTGPFSLVWDIATDVQTVKVPFKFENVTLPN